MRYFALFVLFFLCISSAIPQNGPNFALPTVTCNKVENLTLPADFEVKPGEGFTVIKADCKGTVKWLVISPFIVKYIAIDANNTLILGIPPSGSVNVFAVGLCDGKLTDFAKTVVTVKGKPE